MPPGEYKAGCRQRIAFEAMRDEAPDCVKPSFRRSQKVRPICANSGSDDVPSTERGFSSPIEVALVRRSDAAGTPPLAKPPSPAPRWRSAVGSLDPLRRLPHPPHERRDHTSPLDRLCLEPTVLEPVLITFRRAGALAPVQATSPVRHGRGLAGRCRSGPSTAAGAETQLRWFHGVDPLI